MTNKTLINCVIKAMNIENSYLISKSEELRINGITVIELQLTKEIKDFYKIKNNKYENGYVVARSLVYPIEKIEIPDIYKNIYYPTII